MPYTPDPNLVKMRTQFLGQRKQEAAQGVNQQVQQGSDAIQRRFASLGAGGSGAQIAALQKNTEAGMDAQRKAQGDIAGQEMQLADVDAGRSFQSGLADQDLAFKQKLADVEQGNKVKQLDLAERNFGLEKDAQEFNQRMAEIESGREAPKGALDGIMGSLKGGGPGGKFASGGGLVGAAAKVLGGGGYSCWVFSRMTKEGLKIPSDMKSLMTQFKNNWLTTDPDFSRFYIKKCEPLVKKMDEQKFDWTSLFWFSDSLYTLFRNGQQTAAQHLFQSTVADLVNKYWEDCPHAYASKIREELKADRKSFSETKEPKLDEKDQWLTQECFQDLGKEVFKQAEA
jgi:hypothetical protein